MHTRQIVRMDFGKEEHEQEVNGISGSSPRYWWSRRKRVFLVSIQILRSAGRVLFFEDNAQYRRKSTLFPVTVDARARETSLLESNVIFFFPRVGRNSNKNKRRRNSKTGRNIRNALEKRAGEFYICILATPWAKARDPVASAKQTISTRVIVKKLWSMRRPRKNSRHCDPSLKFWSVAVRSWDEKDSRADT